MLTNFSNKEFGQGISGIASLCSTMTWVSARNIWIERLEASSHTCLMPIMQLLKGWIHLRQTTGRPTHDHFMKLGLAQIMVAAGCFTEARGFHRYVPKKQCKSSVVFCDFTSKFEHNIAWIQAVINPSRFKREDKKPRDNHWRGVGERWLKCYKIIF